MTSERRQAFRREPIEVYLDDNKMISVAPVEWQVRNDLGDELVSQHVQITNEAVKLYIDEDTGIPQLQMKLANRYTDPMKLFEIAGISDQIKGVKLYQNQILELLLAILEVNELDHLKPMVDPNAPTQTPIGGVISSLSSIAAASENGEKMQSTPSSSSPDSAETKSDDSPTPSLEPSSTG